VHYCFLVLISVVRVFIYLFIYFFLALISTVELLKHQLHVEMTQKLTTTDHLLKENIAKLVHSKVMTKGSKCFYFHWGVGQWINMLFCPVSFHLLPLSTLQYTFSTVVQSCVPQPFLCRGTLKYNSTFQKNMLPPFSRFSFVDAGIGLFFPDRLGCSYGGHWDTEWGGKEEGPDLRQ
jgi:hypothetical protein